MAGGIQNTSSVGTRRFDKELNEDVNDFHLPENSWTQARNAINNSITGDLGKLGNEPGNLDCIRAPYTIIGFVHLVGDTWAIYSTDNIDSEIGIFQEDGCIYTTAVNAACLNFSKDHLIKGVSRATSTCTFNLYWDDGLNPSRGMTVTIDQPSDNAYTNPNSPIPWIQNCVIVANCNICSNTPDLDCDAIRLARFIKIPCIQLAKGVGSGTLLNGSYMVAVAYAISGQKISDWIMSNVQGLFNHNNAASSLDVILSDLDQDFDEILVALISVTNQQTAARFAGIYSTRQTGLSFDTIDNTWPAVPIEEFPIMTPIADRTDAMYTVNDYLLRVGPTSKEDFNYQPLANQIVAKWQAVEYPEGYYRRGGNQTNYLRDENYALFIRWIYDTGDKSASYHIPGRPPGTFSSLGPDFNIIANADADPELSVGLIPYNWVVYNTALQTATPGTVLPDGGVVVGEGVMGYWESTEIYPDDKPQIWNSVTNPLAPGFNTGVSPYSAYGLTNLAELDLCGKPIRHHKIPDLGLSPQTQYRDPVSGNIRIMGLKFENIKAPIMNDGITPIPGIVGYEILRGSRNGYKTILAKGLLNNMRTYTIPNGSTSRQGMFPNYPYNEVGGRPDPYLSTGETSFGVCPVFGGGGSGENGYSPQTGYSQFNFTFHSPETNFTDPFLSAKEVKIHGEFNGDVVGKFDKSEEHPKEKLITNTAFLIAAVAGLGTAGLALNGQRTVKYAQPRMPGMSEANLPGLTTWSAPYGVGAATIATAATGIRTSPTFIDNTITIPLIMNTTLSSLPISAYAVYDNLYVDLGLNLTGNIVGNTTDTSFSTLFSQWGVANSSTDAFSTRTRDIDQDDGSLKNIPSIIRALSGLPVFFNYFTQATDTFIDLFKAIVRFRDYALRYHSHCFYDRYRNPIIGNQRRVLQEQEYLGPQITDFGLNVRINNLYRSKTVALQITNTNAISDTQVNDVTRIIASQVDVLHQPTIIFPFNNVLIDPTRASFGQNTTYNTYATTPVAPGNAGFFYPGHSGIQIASSHYSSLKQRLRNQYGQINGITQVLTGSCTMVAPVIGQPTTSDVIFGGDTYIGRYTEKNTFFFFYNWLYGQPDGAQFDYTKNEMIPYPRFWGNFDKFETGDFMGSVIDFITPGGGGFFNPAVLILPNTFYNMDGIACLPGGWLNPLALRLAIRDCWFYLFNSGVKDFFVESEINIDLRDWGALESEQHYDPYRYGDTREMFNTKIIKTGNYYKYDQSLSVSKIFISYTSWGTPQQINYDPFIAETCFTYSPRRLIYSLPAQFEGTRDNWYIFLPNNYKDFLSKVTCVKSVNKSGAIIFFETESPVQFQGLDQLQTTGGTKLTIGDGGLFTQPLQNVVNADRPYEYASCQDRLSVINTPAGIFWISQNQGKIFNFQGGLAEISMQDLKWWFAAYLPYKLTQLFPNFELTDNTVVGIGCQAIYDNENALVYFTKRDFVLIDGIGVYNPLSPLDPGTLLEYVSSDDFNVLVDGVFQFAIKLGDPSYFEDASWTVSYDPKTKGWISFHDWHPNLMLPGKNTFLTTLDNGVWIHNKRCDLYCNYYGVDYPFEIEYMVNTIQTVNTLRSIQYILEVYKYAPNCFDRFHILDANFDQAVIYNTEQVSGLLNLVLEPRNDPQGILLYPIINFNSIDILFSKVENKYRFNQFWDVTDDRGEYNPSAQRMIWNTGANGYVRVLNQFNLNYVKDEFQRKKFRHYTNSVFLRRRISGNNKMLVMLTNNKNLESPR